MAAAAEADAAAAAAVVDINEHDECKKLDIVSADNTRDVERNRRCIAFAGRESKSDV